MNIRADMNGALEVRVQGPARKLTKAERREVEWEVYPAGKGKKSELVFVLGDDGKKVIDVIG